ncbi:MAG TPA: hypothetical protein VGK81_05735 [Anaerolineae bacterium]
MNIPLTKLNYTFRAKPLLIGGMAMEYYGLRKAGTDIDLVVIREDYTALAQSYPDRLKDLWGDLGVCPYEFEIWTSIMLFEYADLAMDAIDAGDYLVISLEKLLFLKTLGMQVEKYHNDMELIVKKITTDRYAAWWPTLDKERQDWYLSHNK